MTASSCNCGTGGSAWLGSPGWPWILADLEEDCPGQLHHLDPSVVAYMAVRLVNESVGRDTEPSLTALTPLGDAVGVAWCV